MTAESQTKVNSTRTMLSAVAVICSCSDCYNHLSKTLQDPLQTNLRKTLFFDIKGKINPQAAG